MSTHNAQTVDGIATAVTVKGQFLKKNATGFGLGDTLGERTDGVAFSDAAIGQAVGIQIGGNIQVKVGVVAIVNGAEVTTNALGLAITAVATNIVRCKAVEAGAAGGYMECIWVDAYIKP